tara:strand:- start:1036 stop:1533 length:498 start_codon:yes stop_codon:yes gene_type:complete
MSSHKKFVRNLVDSIEPQFVVARWLHLHGRTVTIEGLRVAPSADQQDDYVDHGDIRDHTSGIIEVKSITRNFHDEGSWPFGSEIFVANVKSVDRRRAEVAAYITVSADLRFGAIINCLTNSDWSIKSVKDPKTGSDYLVYVARTSDASFVDLSAPPKHIKIILGD